MLISEYNAVCTNGHIFNPHKGSIIEQQAIAKWNRGCLDAVMVCREHCPICQGHETPQSVGPEVIQPEPPMHGVFTLQIGNSNPVPVKV